MSEKREFKFIADVMVGKLARYLRMAGYDVVYINDADDELILEIARSEKRIVLTRDTMMLERRDFKNGILRSVFISHDSLGEQLQQVKSEMGIELSPDLVVCLVCNSPLCDVKKEYVSGKVPPYVFKTQDKFKYCKNCGRYYWRGTHYEYMQRYFNRLNRI